MGERPVGAPLDKSQIVSTALRLLDEVGLDGLTLRRLASELGVQAPALYWHVRNKRELLDAMAEAMIAEMLPAGSRQPAPGQPWWEWLIERSRLMRRAAAARRDGALVLTGNRPTISALPEIDRMLGVLVEAGLPPAEALSGILALNAYTMGWVIEEQAARRRADEAAGDGPADGDRALARSVTDAGRFPRLAVAMTTLGPGFGEKAFELGLHAMVAGLRERAGRSARRAGVAGPGGPAGHRRGDEEADQPVEFGDRIVGESAVDR